MSDSMHIWAQDLAKSLICYTITALLVLVINILFTFIETHPSVDWFGEHNTSYWWMEGVIIFSFSFGLLFLEKGGQYAKDCTSYMRTALYLKLSEGGKVKLQNSANFLNYAFYGAHLVIFSLFIFQPGIRTIIAIVILVIGVLVFVCPLLVKVGKKRDSVLKEEKYHPDQPRKEMMLEITCPRCGLVYSTRGRKSMSFPMWSCRCCGKSLCSRCRGWTPPGGTTIPLCNECVKLMTAEEISEWQKLEKAKGPNRTRLFRITSPFGYGAAIVLTIITIMSYPNVLFYLGGFLVVGVLFLWCALGLGLTAIIPGQRRILKALKARRVAASQM